MGRIAIFIDGAYVQYTLRDESRFIIRDPAAFLPTLSGLP